MILETERLFLRNWLASDVKHYLMLANDVGYNCFSPPGRFLVRTTEEAEGKIRDRMALFDQRRLGKFPIFLKKTEEFVGTCGLEPFDLDGRSEVELGYRLCLGHWGQGYATEAARAVLRYGFEELHSTRIMAFVLAQNRASIRVLEKLGFQYLREFLHAELPHRLYSTMPDRALRQNTAVVNG
jgi:[ribosomal protein S5]-alanine N-acetyltransferase